MKLSELISRLNTYKILYDDNIYVKILVQRTPEETDCKNIYSEGKCNSFDVTNNLYEFIYDFNLCYNIDKKIIKLEIKKD